MKRRAYIVELSSEMEQCIPAVNDVESYVDGVEIGRVISTFLRKQPKEKRIIFMHEVAVQVWTDTYEENNKIQYDKNGFPVMPDYTRL